MDLLKRSNTKILKGIHKMSKIAIINILLLGLILAITACGGQDSQQPVKATWIKPQLSGETVSLPVSEVDNNKIVHFNVAVATGGAMAFMAYEYDGKLNVRANICPPCRSVGFSLAEDTLVCDTCLTTFESNTGEGISGACVAYPKESVKYEISDGKVIMQGNDLISAYESTQESG
ncbi:Fe-S-containing protein [Chloroflexota bacterium]